MLNRVQKMHLTLAMGTAEHYQRSLSGVSNTNFDQSVYSLTLPIAGFEIVFCTSLMFFVSLK